MAEMPAGARPGIVMLADAQVGDTYSQERAEGVAEDKAGVGHIKTIMVKGGQEESYLVEIVMDD